MTFASLRMPIPTFDHTSSNVVLPDWTQFTVLFWTSKAHHQMQSEGNIYETSFGLVQSYQRGIWSSQRLTLYSDGAFNALVQTSEKEQAISFKASIALRTCAVFTQLSQEYTFKFGPSFKDVLIGCSVNRYRNNFRVNHQWSPEIKWLSSLTWLTYRWHVAADDKYH